MKKILTLLIIGTLILTAGCSNAAPVSERERSQPESSSPDSIRRGADGEQARPFDFGNENSQNGIMGKITTISGNTITLAIGTMNRPGGASEGRERPAGRDGSQPEGAPEIPDRRSGDSMPQGERPADGAGGGPGGRFPGGFMDLEYSGEEISYTLSDTVTITKGMGENSESIIISDLAEGDIVLLLLDEAKQPVSVQVFASNRENE